MTDTPDTYSERFRAAIQEAFPGADIVRIIPVLWDGWELDNRVALIIYGGRRILVHSDHGNVVETTMTFLRDKQAEYEQAAKATAELLDIAPGVILRPME